MRLAIGILGLGMAGARMVPAVMRNSRTALAGVADPNPTLRARFAADHQLPSFANAEELFKSAEIDAVYIATPHELHREHAVLAAKYGKHIIVEKPMALALEDCDAMNAAANSAGVIMIVGHTHSFDPSVSLIRKLIAGGDFGRISMMNSFYYSDFLYRPRRPEELDTLKGGGIMFNQIPHQIDMLRSIAGSEVTSVRAKTAILDPTRPTEGACNAFIYFANDAAATLTYSGYDRFDSDEFHEWVGEVGNPKTPRHGQTRRALRNLVTPDAERLTRSTAYGYGAKRYSASNSTDSRQPHFGTLIISCEHADIRQSPDGVLVYSDEGVKEYRAEHSAGLAGRDRVLDELCDAVLEGIPPVHNGVFAKGTLEVALAILKSSQERREIRIV